MPITLEKLFSATVSSSFEYMDETVHMVWAPARYTGEMYDLAEKMDRELEEANEEIDGLKEGETRKAQRILARARQVDRRGVRTFLSTLLVSWDVMESPKVPYPTDEEALLKLDPDFLAAAFLSLGSANEADPPRPDVSDEPSEPKASPAPSRRGTRSSAERTTSALLHGT